MDHVTVSGDSQYYYVSDSSGRVIARYDSERQARIGCELINSLIDAPARITADDEKAELARREWVKENHPEYFHAVEEAHPPYRPGWSIVTATAMRRDLGAAIEAQANAEGGIPLPTKQFYAAKEAALLIAPNVAEDVSDKVRIHLSGYSGPTLREVTVRVTTSYAYDA